MFNDLELIIFSRRFNYTFILFELKLIIIKYIYTSLSYLKNRYLRGRQC